MGLGSTLKGLTKKMIGYQKMGASVDALQREGKEAASTMSRKQGELVQEDINKLKKAIENNHPQVIQEFVKLNTHNIDIADEDDGYTLLALAVHYGRVEMVEILLKNGADPNIPNAGGKE